MLWKEEDHQMLLILNQSDEFEEKYQRGPKKFYKPSLKGELDRRELKDWIKYSKRNPSSLLII